MSSKRYTFFKGRVALYALLKAAGIGPGDKVLLPGYTCVVVPNAIIYTGAEPVFLDIDAASYNLAPANLDTWLAENPGPEAKAVIVQHTYGIPCDMEAISSLARKRNLLVIEDSCHALGSSYRGRPVGSLGDAAFFSSQWSKPLTTGLGGWAVVNNPDLEDRLQAILPDFPRPGPIESSFLLLQHLAYEMVFQPRLFWMIQGLYRKLGNLGLVIGSSTAAELSCRETPGYMKAMGRIQERQLHRFLAGMERTIELRRHQRALAEELLTRAGFRTLDLPEEVDPVVLRYPVRVDNKSGLLSAARRSRIQLGDWFASPIHPNMTHWEVAGYDPGSCPVAEEASGTTVNIPFGPRNSDREIGRTVDFLAEFAVPAGGLPHE